MVDPWTGPPPSPQQFPANQPDGIKKLLEKIRAVETQLRDVRSHLPGSGITNPMLASPVAPGLVYAYATNFALSLTLTTKLTATITVPPGFTECAVSMSSRVFAFNPNTTGGADGGGGDYIYNNTNIAGVSPAVIPPIFAAGSGLAADSISPFSQLLSSLTPGSTFDITVEAKTSMLAWAANTSNQVIMSGSLLWFR